MSGERDRTGVVWGSLCPLAHCTQPVPQRLESDDKGIETYSGMHTVAEPYYRCSTKWRHRPPRRHVDHPARPPTNLAGW